MKTKGYNAYIRTVSFMLTVLMLLLLIPSARAEGEDGSTLKNVSVGFYQMENFQTGDSEDEPMTGFGYEYLQKLAGYAKWNCTYTYGTWSELYSKLQSGKIDLLAGVPYSEERAETVSFAGESMYIDICALYKSNTNRKIKPARLSTMNECTIGVIKGFTAEDALNSWLETNSLACTVVEYETYDQLFAALDNSDVNVIAAPESAVNGDRDWTRLAEIAAEERYICTSKASAGLMEELNAAIEETAAAEPEFFEELQLKYFSDSLMRITTPTVERIYIGYIDDCLPLSSSRNTVIATGFVAALGDEISSQLPDVDIQYYAYKTYGEMISALKDGSIDAAFPVYSDAWNAEQNDIVITSEAVGATMTMIYAGELPDEPEMTIAVSNTNPIQSIYAAYYYPESALVNYEDDTACLDAVKAGDVSCTLLNTCRFEYLITGGKYKSLETQKLADGNGYSMALRSDDTVRLALLNSAIAATDKAQAADDLNSYARYEYGLADYAADNKVKLTIIGATAGALMVALAAIFALILLLLTQKQKKTEQQLEKVEEDLQTERRSGEAAMHAQYNGKRVLVADDNRLNADMLGEILAEFGVESDIAKNGAECVAKLEKAESGTYSLIFMDLQMPVMDGYTASETIRGLGDGKGSIPIVALTASVFEESRARAGQTGMNDFLEKPIDINVLARVLKKWMD